MHRSGKITLILTSFFVAALGLASPLSAQPAAPEATPEEATPEEATPEDSDGPSAEDLEKAKEHYAKGKAFFDASEFEKAVDEFKESYKLSKNPVLLYNIAHTHDEIGDAAHGTFLL